MSEFPRIWQNLVNSETGLPVVVKTVQKIMDATHHPDHISVHDEFELVYLQEIDRGTFYIDDKTVSVRTDDLILIKPRIPHYLKVECTRPCRFVVLKFSFAQSDESNISNISANDFLSFISENNDFGGFFKLSSNYCLNISTIMQQIMHEDKSPDGESAFLRSLLTMELFVWLSRSLREQWETNLSTKGHKLQEILESAKAYINNNYNNDISLSDVADAVKLTPNHLSSIFKKHFGISYIDYLCNQRLEQSKALMSDKELTINKISKMVGFNSPAYFTERFKKRFGISPIKYRNENNL